MTVVDRTVRVPLWQRIAHALLHEIETGRFKEGDRLPSENSLAPRFGVTRATVRRALLELHHKGLVRAEQGRGVFVERRLVYGIGPRSTFQENLLKAELKADCTIHAHFETPAGAELAAALAIPVEAPVVVFETTAKAGGAIISFARHHLPAALFPGTRERITGFGGITDVYDAYGFSESCRARCEIVARLPTPEEARRLEQPAAEPLLELRSIKTSAGQPIDFTLARFRAGLVSLLLEQ